MGTIYVNLKQIYSVNNLPNVIRIFAFYKKYYKTFWPLFSDKVLYLCFIFIFTCIYLLCNAYGLI